ncbi:MAG: electron transfer flavoprotein subunit alpha/FixB family protein [Deltaproteobacteria bacterium]|nr:electron transfer flavoprotein subunit alpha/FixB family protein [Deltaproteobacteria bacterium]
MTEILVVAEYSKQHLTEVSLQMLSKGRKLADQSGMELNSVIIGRDVGQHAETLARWADRVLVVNNGNWDTSLPEPYQKILVPLIKKRKPKIVLLGHSSFGMDLAPSLSVELEAPLITDCIDINIEDSTLLITRSIYNGKVNAVYSFSPCETMMITGRVGEFDIGECDKHGQIEEVDFHLEDISYKKYEGFIEPKTGGIDISQAEVLVSVGRGIKGKENLEMVERLADLLGGQVSCSRPVVDCDWLPSEHQVGLSGKVVKPKLYIALGISGAFQHILGMKASKMIVAINQDAQASIFNTANYGIVDDIFKVVPELTKKIVELKGEGSIS